MYYSRGLIYIWIYSRGKMTFWGILGAKRYDLKWPSRYQGNVYRRFPSLKREPADPTPIRG